MWTGETEVFWKRWCHTSYFPCFGVSCGRAKTIRIRQRILRKYSEVKKNTHTLLCQTWQSTGIFKYIFKGHCPDYAHARRTFIFFLHKDLSRFCRSLGRLATLKASSTRLTAFVKVNSSQRSICGASQHYRLCDYWHVRPSKSLPLFSVGCYGSHFVQ